MTDAQLLELAHKNDLCAIVLLHRWGWEYSKAPKHLGNGPNKWLIKTEKLIADLRHKKRDGVGVVKRRLQGHMKHV